MNQQNQFLWVEKYRPTKVEDVILPPRIKTIFQGFVARGNIPNLVAYGGPGVGKTTIVRAAIAELESHSILVNGSLSGNIDTLRNDISRFASTLSFNKKRKYVILDEADYLTHVTQAALRGFMEEFADNCGFILTCNFKEKLIDALVESRTPQVSFNFDKSERDKLSALFFRRVKQILETEGVKFQPATVAKVIDAYFPDWRRVLGELQLHSSSGEIGLDILTKIGQSDLGNLLPVMKTKNFTQVRQWVADNKDEPQQIYNTFYTKCSDLFQSSYIPRLIVTLADYQYQSYFARNQEIHLAAMLAVIMAEAEWR